MPRYEAVAKRWPALWQSLSLARRSNRMAHAFLVQSDLPETREEFTIALLMLAACREADKTGEPCGRCFSCRHLENDTYPELHHLSPIGKAYQIQVGDRQGPEVNTVRYFTEQFYLTDISGAACKIGIIHDADRMNAEAQNALLKTLEEPPPATMIVLTTGNPASLLPTTRSRCQQIQLLENRVEFNYPGAGKVFAALAKLFLEAGDDILQGEAAAEVLIAVAAALKSEAEGAAEADWDGRLKEAAAFDAALAKRLEKLMESEGAGAYMKNRAAFLSSIHSFAGQLYLLSEGADRGMMANPEILPENMPEKVDQARAARMLEQAESLLFNMRFNVNEELALRDFAVQCVSMPQIR